MPTSPAQPVSVRLATPADLDAVVRIDVRSFTRHWPADDFAEQLADPRVAIWIAEVQGAPCGYVHVRAIPGEAELLNIAVQPSARRQGVAARLLDHAQDQALQGGAERMFLEVRADNEAALGLYRRAAWEQIGIRKRYYSEDGADAIVMSIDLVERAAAQKAALDEPIPAE